MANGFVGVVHRLLAFGDGFVRQFLLNIEVLPPLLADPGADTEQDDRGQRDSADESRLSRAAFGHLTAALDHADRPRLDRAIIEERL